tara:strand:+ start:2357 stop:3217 length:861 start_codon:yes stop_codon:yes gene_type:complete
MKIGFIADFFADEIPGGGELNNDELMRLLSANDHEVLKIKSEMCTDGAFEHLEKEGYTHFIVANFAALPTLAKKELAHKTYIIYEHDHKYLAGRNPAIFKDFLAPKSALVNIEFYKEAKAVICQTTFHQKIVKKNLEIDNIISVGGNLWSNDILDFLSELATVEKKEKCSVMVSPIPHKNTADAIKFCNLKKMEYELVPPLPYRDFLSRLGQNNTLVFLPKTPETLSRIVVEARMMGMKTITNNLVGATKEDWFKLKGAELVDAMRAKREEIVTTVIGLLSDVSQS